MKKILVLGANHSQVDYLKKINNLGYEIILADINPQCPGRLMAAKYYEIGYTEIEKIIEIGVKESFKSNDKVFTAASQFSHICGSEFASYFGISYPDKKIIELCLDKKKFYPAFQEFGIDIPRTMFIKNEKELREAIANNDVDNIFYLKSDFSKNPNYVYKFFKNNPPWKNFFWDKDRYLREGYLLQPEILGVSLRLNFMFNSFNVFDFISGDKTCHYDQRLLDMGIVQKLLLFLEKYNLDRWLIKFDIILGSDYYAILDIGLDPPSRMRKYLESHSIDFIGSYIDQYINNIDSFPLGIRRKIG